MIERLSQDCALIQGDLPGSQYLPSIAKMKQENAKDLKGPRNRDTHNSATSWRCSGVLHQAFLPWL
ncbi:hypothetical protein HFU84_11750 [Acidithiobacillus sp. CV18-2]|uniref:Uncharacterized protein n=1 Tax=Igneacidithiobacillus copahuensis TaxID=2724909 RepID=A0AAE2YQF9_9PROT|nr:hypothetical protein [Igneacidithiobacillus copahuensis]MBU2754278.1 hypothetical protein [Acidithiobacillus sp. CV18-3]MBU2757396.1 hypothetical protein [Acidithiobacillus sp. BN09-2]MBU2778165.1 hypothetical protein [Acidithiobacillus sp. CV18-2]MBU2797911.1 hypothetical protein [Acidithiobacillus sp. VAN18-2]MBU2800109.1 hypothetical protein [Acidithiobacillus sp. VAN18-4]UTV80132.1 hypothetical protein MQE22_08860 [Acidithiobacillus sp. YTS05]